MAFSEAVILEVMEANGYQSPSLQRMARFCRWYEVRKGQERFEIEAYDSTLLADEQMTAYLQSLKDIPPEVNYVRRITELIVERDVTLVIRPFLEGEPLYQVFLRPGKLPLEKASYITKAFEQIHQNLLKAPLENFSPLAILFFLKTGNDPGVLLDGRRCGPWIKHYKHINVIYNYLNPELSWSCQVNYFRNRMVLKLFLGNPNYTGDELPSELKEAPIFVQEFVRQALQDPEDFQGRLSDLEKKQAPVNKTKWVKYALCLSIVFLLVIAFAIRNWQLTGSWQGALAVGEEVLSKDEQGNNTQPDEDEPLESKVSHSFLQKIENIKALMLQGNFFEARGRIKLLGKEQLSPLEKREFIPLKTSYPVLRKEDFEDALKKGKSYLIAGKYNLAVLVMNDVVKRYVEGREVDEARRFINHVKKIEQGALEQKKEELTQRKENLVKDRELMLKVLQLQKRAAANPVIGLSGLNQSFELLNLELRSEPALYLLSCYKLLNEGEIALYKNLVETKNEAARQAVFSYLRTSVNELQGKVIVSIKEDSFAFRDGAVEEDFKFTQLSSKQLYEIFRHSSVENSDMAPYWLYLFCVKYGLKNLAEKEIKNIKKQEHLEKADSLKGMENASKELFGSR